MAKNKIFMEGKHVTLTAAALIGAKSGDPVAIGSITGVLLGDATAAGKVVIDREGVYDLLVHADNGSGSAVAVGDAIYYNSGNTPKLDKAVAGTLFGYALETITSGAEATIQVLLAATPPTSAGDTVATYIGTLGDLTTTTKTNLVAAINEVNGDGGDMAPTEYTATSPAAIPTSVRLVELKHNSTAIEKTIASLVPYAGKIVVVKNTSASGTAAHKVTVTTGTWDGTNKVITLNAPGECIHVYVDSAGNGTILSNVGSVGLS